MTLAFTTVNSQGVYRDYVYSISDLEEITDFLNPVLLPGDQLVNVRIHDQQQAIDLPVDVFDGEDFSLAFQQVAQQWQEILAPAVSVFSEDLLLKRIVQKQLRFCRKNIQETELFIKWLTARVLLIRLGIRTDRERLARYELLLAKSQKYLFILNNDHLLLSDILIELHNA